MRVLSSNSVSRSCVTITTVRPMPLCKARSSVTKLSELSGSSPAVGSSSSSSGGSMARARASATRLTMPPDKSLGIFSATSGFRPTICSLTMAASRINPAGRVLSSRSGKAMFSSTVKAENSAPCWNSMPTRLAAPRRPSSATGLPSTVISPFVGCSSPSIWRSNTVLPVPEPPTSDSTSPRTTVRSRSLWITASFSPFLNTVQSFLISTTASVIRCQCL